MFENQNFLVVGAARSGKSSAKTLLSLGANVFVYDDKMSLSDANYFESKKCIVLSKQQIEEVIDDIYTVIISPSIWQNNDVVLLSKKCGKRIISELELGAMLCKAPILAITGTNGKSTTVTLLHNILLEAGKVSYLLGNIGLPFCEKVLEIEKEDYVCLEVSSFQLEAIETFSPHVGCILNITPDHLDRHISMEHYQNLKLRIFQNQTQSEWKVVDWDDENLKENTKIFKSKRLFYSLNKKVEGAYIENEVIYFLFNGVRERIIKVCDVALIGEHNLRNVLCAVCIAKIVGVSSNIIARVLKKFIGLRHRIEKVITYDNKTYFNDSKATNVDSTLKAVKCMKKDTVLLLGGRDKDGDFDGLFENLPSNVSHIILFGEARYKILEVAIKKDYSNISVCADLNTAVVCAKERCVAGGNVLFSPACASFDAFNNYKERGDYFCEVVKAMCGAQDGI